MKKRINNNSQVLALAIAAVTAASVAQYAVALPANNSHSTEQGVSNYNNGLLEFGEDNSVAAFTTFNVGAGEVFQVRPTGSCDASCSGMARVNTGVSTIDGTFDLGMNFFLLNQNGIVFGNGFTLDTSSVAASSGMQPGLVATTYNISSADFNAGGRTFDSSGSVGGIEVNGLSSANSKNQILLISHDINIDGVVNLPEGVFSAVSGGTVEVLLSNPDNLLQFNITSALDTTPGQAVISVNSGSTVTAGEVALAANVDDPLSFAVNNQGILTASGIDVSDNGVVTLVGNGGVLLSRGEINAVDGDIDISAKDILAQGTIDAGNGDITFSVGRSADGNDAAIEGELLLADAIDVRAAQMTVNGFGGRNKLTGLTNYVVSGLNTGAAQLENVGSITFNNFSWLVGKSNVAHEFRVLQGGTLLDNFMGQAEGRIDGGNFNDTFLIEGAVENLFGRIGNDTFTLNGGRVNQLIDGGNETLGGGDTLLNVLNPVLDTSAPASGSSDGVAGSANYVSQWIDVESVTPFEPPVVVPGVDAPNVLTPILPFDEFNPDANVVAGFVGDGEPLLPCGFNALYGAANLSWETENCAEENPEFLAMQSSLIHFDNDSTTITEESASRLRRVSEFVVGTDLVNKVRIEGHTDDNASEAYNLALSKRRAKTAAAFMQEQGVSAELMHLQYFGESLPMVPNDSEENRALNRRAVIELESK